MKKKLKLLVILFVFCCRLTDDLVNFVLKLAVKDSCVLLSKAQAAGAKQEEFDALLCGIPVSSSDLCMCMTERDLTIFKNCFM